MDPRFRRLAIAGVLFVAIVAARVLATDPSDGWLFLLIVPIAIVAIEYAFVGGALMATLASLAVVVLKLSDAMTYSTLGIIVRIAAFYFAGAGVGYLSAERRRREGEIGELERRARTHREALELNDDVIQGLAVAKMALEMGDADKARTTLEATLKRAQEIASERLTHEGPLTRVRRDVADPAGQ